MSIDYQGSAAITLLKSLGYVWREGAWGAPNESETYPPILEAADILHGIVMDRAAVLAGHTEGSDQQIELAIISDALQKYEEARRSHGEGAQR